MFQPSSACHVEHNIEIKNVSFISDITERNVSVMERNRFEFKKFFFKTEKKNQFRTTFLSQETSLRLDINYFSLICSKGKIHNFLRVFLDMKKKLPRRNSLLTYSRKKDWKSEISSGSSSVPHSKVFSLVLDKKRISVLFKRLVRGLARPQAARE